LRHHLATLNGEAVAWGWKEPRSIYLLPFYRRRMPDLRFLHVVRDGRDMALSSNQNQLRKHGAMLLAPEELELPPPVQSITLWSRINLQATAFGEQVLGER